MKHLIEVKVDKEKLEKNIRESIEKKVKEKLSK